MKYACKYEIICYNNPEEVALTSVGLQQNVYRIIILYTHRKHVSCWFVNHILRKDIV